MLRLAPLALLLAGRVLLAQITVVSATYGGNVGAPKGNVTAHLAATCNGKTTCDYMISAAVIGDPVPGKAKDYKAEWTCAGTTTVKTITVPPEAGFATVITLACPPPGSQVFEWTISYVCRPPAPQCTTAPWTNTVKYTVVNPDYPGVTATINVVSGKSATPSPTPAH